MHHGDCARDAGASRKLCKGCWGITEIVQRMLGHHGNCAKDAGHHGNCAQDAGHHGNYAQDARTSR